MSNTTASDLPPRRTGRLPPSGVAAAPIPVTGPVQDLTAELGLDDADPLAALADAGGRAPARTEARRPVRFAPVQPENRYTIPPNRIPAGMTAEWKALSVFGVPNRNHMVELCRAGWVPAKASDFPEFSGYGTDFAPAVLAMGNMKPCQADDPVVINQLILMLRPKEYSDEAVEQHRADSRTQMNDQLRRLALTSRAAVGAGNTKITRQYVGDPG